MKDFDCVEMKRKGSERILAETQGMTPEEELRYWEEKSRSFIQWHQTAREERREQTSTR